MVLRVRPSSVLLGSALGLAVPVLQVLRGHLLPWQPHIPTQELHTPHPAALLGHTFHPVQVLQGKGQEQTWCRLLSQGELWPSHRRSAHTHAHTEGIPTAPGSPALTCTSSCFPINHYCCHHITHGHTPVQACLIASPGSRKKQSHHRFLRPWHLM